VTLYLADTSAWTRSSANRRIALRWARALAANEVAVCTPVLLELLFSARNPLDYATRRQELRGFPKLPIDLHVEEAAERAQQRLASGSHRGLRPVDLLIAAVAEVHGATLLHYDKHFDLIARVTGQPSEWLARRGSLD
jgi:predicted nucleic acid-binding protein